MEKNRYKFNWKHPEKSKTRIALNELRDKYHISTWSGANLRIEEEDLE